METDIQQYRRIVEKPLKTFLDKRRNLIDTDAECHKKGEKLKSCKLHETQKHISEYLLEPIKKIDVATTSPNAMTALRLLLALSCGIASGERRFSVLKRVKRQLRSTISQEHVIALCLMAANVDVLRALDPKKNICNFAALKARRMKLAAFFIEPSLKCPLRESGCRIGYELTKVSRDHFWRSMSRDTNVEVSALSPLAV